MLDLVKAEHMLERLPVRDRFTRRLVPFRLNHNQRVIMRKLQEAQRKRQLLRAIVLKARRVGVSALTDALAVLHCMSGDGKKAQIVAHEFKSSAGLIEVPMNVVTKSLPGQKSLIHMLGLPKPNKHELVFPYEYGESTLEIATAGNIAGGRGLGFSFLHLSECAYYSGLESFASLLPTVPRDLSTMILLESTANGREWEGKTFYEYWKDAEQGKSEYLPIFIPWMDDPTCIADPALATDAPIDDEEKMLMKEFKVTKAQLAWRRMTLNTDCRGYVALFRQEYPHTPESAFISSGDPVFDAEEITYARNQVRKPLCTGRLERAAGSGRDAIVFHEQSSLLLVWELPQPNTKYYIGADAARGEDTGDFAAYVGWNGNTGEMAFRFTDRINPEALADHLDKIGRYYNNAMVNVELTGNLGLWTQKLLRDHYMYPNLYRWKGQRDDKLGSGSPKGMGGYNSAGWETGMRSRELAMTAFRSGIRARLVKPRDEALVSQMDMATRKDAMRWEVEYEHDDLIMAAIIGWIAREQWHPAIMSNERSRLGNPVGEDSTFAYDDDVTTALRRHFAGIQRYNRLRGKAGENRMEGV